MVKRFWIIGRGYGTSLMLLATLALVLHSGVVAASGFGLGDCAGVSDHAATATHIHVQADGSSHAHAKAATPSMALAGQADQVGDAQPCEAPCCGASCTLAVLTPPMLTLAITSFTLVVTLPLDEALGGIDPNVLNRPPRPLLTV